VLKEEEEDFFCIYYNEYAIIHFIITCIIIKVIANAYRYNPQAAALSLCVLKINAAARRSM